ncbi:MAG: class III extradiol dioxygenase subunit B-like domain-containing protein [bacterium]|nr:class III extradiol dioxygenase subunit B-like domain-containing protein [bacterium]
MPIVFSAIASHSPLLLEGVGKSNRRRLKTTLESYAELERLLYAAKPETLAVISPHGDVLPDVFSIGLAHRFTADFSAFGDFSLQPEWHSDPVTAQALRTADESLHQAQPHVLATQRTLDHGITVPAVLLTPHLPSLALLPFHTAGLVATAHWRFGQHVGNGLRTSSRRVAVIASADLSHRLSKTSPAGFSPQAAAFDRQLLEYVRRGDAASIIGVDPALAAVVACCGHLPIAFLLGILDGMNVTPSVLSYEGPFGVGHLMAAYRFG